MINLCGPAIIYLIFSVTQIIIDVFKGLYNTAFMKAIVMVMVTLLLNILCQKGLSVVSWIIVFIPFIMMTVVVSMLLYVFGLDPARGKLNIKCDNCSTTKKGNLIFSSNVNTPIKHIDVSYSETPLETTEPNTLYPFASSDPQYE